MAPGYNKYKIDFRYVTVILLCVVFISCKRDMATLNAIMNPESFPEHSAKNFEVHWTDSAKLQFVFKGPRMLRFSSVDEPYVEFPKGIEFIMYNDSGALETTITADYAKYLENEETWEARNNVVAIRHSSNQKLTTEQLFWNQKTKMIYSKVFTKITEEEGFYIGENGFEAQQDFLNYKLFGAKTEFLVEDEELE